MFGLDLLFDLDKNGKLDALEQAAALDFLDTADIDAGFGKTGSSGKSGKRKSIFDYDPFDAQDEEDC